MSDTYVVAVEGLSGLHGLDTIPRAVQLAAIRAVNGTADYAAAQSRKRIREQIGFPASYLTGKDGAGRQRLGVTKKARGSDLEAVITGRHRPTMLARFATSGTPGGKNGVRVEVAPGFAKFMRRAFLIRLPAGRGGSVETKSNMGLAIRLKPGERIENKKKMVQIGKGGPYLLFGPSVDQIAATVFGEVSPETSEYLSTEFARLLELDL